MTERQCHKCDRTALPGSDACSMHDRASAVERGKKGGKAKHANARLRSAAKASAIRMACIQDLRDVLTLATQQAFTNRDWSVVISAVRCGLELIKGDFEAEVRGLREAVEEYVMRRERMQ